MHDDQQFAFTPLLPTYSEVRQMQPIFAGIRKALVTTYFSEIHALAGTPQQPLDWLNPDEWIDERLAGPSRKFAWRVWLESSRTVNPRHLRGSYYFINRHHLLDLDPQGEYVRSATTDAFLAQEPELIRQLDEREGLSMLLGILQTKGLARRNDLLPEWAEYVRAVSKNQKDPSIKSLLYYRLVNLADRELITRDGGYYSITEAGLEHATVPTRRGRQFAEVEDPRQAVARAIRDYNNAQAKRLRQMIGEMPPYQFEHLVRDLLDAMGYQDVVVTRESGDRGVDVAATVQFGITTIREVVQVKRHQGTITRPTIDQLRGALPYHGALRGTIITTGTFSKGCPEAALFQGAAPITLIDGDRLMDLLIEHGIGIHQRPAMLYEIDAELFAPDSEQAEIEEALIEDV